MEVKYKYAWFYHLDSGEYIILRVTEEAQEGGKLYFDTFEEAKEDLICHLTDCISDAFDEITTLSEEIFSLGKKVQQANDITTWTE